jgi:hypothetical protein
MGFKKKPRHYRLTFQDEDLEGFECTMAGLTVDEFLSITALADTITGESSQEDAGRFFEIMAEKIISWNLEDEDDNPIGHSPADIRAQDFDFMMTIQMAWLGAMASVPGPLLNGSANGGTIPEGITQTLASLSRSLPNSPGPG